MNSEDVRVLLSRVYAEPHRLVDLLVEAADEDAAKHALEIEFGINAEEAQVVIDQAFSSLVRRRMDLMRASIGTKTSSATVGRCVRLLGDG